MNTYFKDCLRQWKWFAATVCICVVLAILYILVTVPKYERSASVLVKDENGGGGLLSGGRSGAGRPGVGGGAAARRSRRLQALSLRLPLSVTFDNLAQLLDVV